jgi:glycosyltransferase involved in cell wall biosynthesis
MRISVVMCTFNGAAYLPRQLHSLAAQTRRPDELVVFDDGSTDGTVEILRSFAASAPFTVRWQTHPENLGQAANFQLALSAANGDILALCDQDDVWYPEKLEIFESAFASHPIPDFVFCDADLVDAQLRPLARGLWQSIGFGKRQLAYADAGRLWSVLVRFNAVTGTAMAFSAKWKDLILPIPKGWVHDGWIALLLSIAGRYEIICRRLLAYRCHSQQQIGPGPDSLQGQIAAARRMDLAYFQRLGDNFAAALDRLTGLDVDPSVVRLLSAKVAHCRSRALMRTEGNGRLPWIVAELLRQRYQTCSLGWKSLVQDLWMANPMI